MSYNNFIDSTRLSRARQISDKSLLEFKILKENPLICFGIIQGGSKTPYICVIDIQQNMVGHSCPDFNKSSNYNRGSGYNRYRSSGAGWCKHLGKVLLELPNATILQIEQKLDSFSYIKDKEKLQFILKEFKEEDVINNLNSSDNDNSSNLDFVEKTTALSKLLLTTNKLPRKLIVKIQKMMKFEFSQNNDLLSLLQMKSALECLYEGSQEKYMEIFSKDYKKYLNRIFIKFKTKFWIRSLLLNLEYAFLISKIRRKFNSRLQLNDLLIPQTASMTQIHDAIIILKLLLTSKTSVNRILKRWKIDKSDTLLMYRLRRCLNSVEFNGLSIPEVQNWISKELKDYLEVHETASKVDDFLIYLMESVGEKPSIKLKYNRDVIYMPIGPIEKYPSFRYVLGRIKESERNYLTYDEVKRHGKIFDWLSGDKVKSIWKEIPRSKETSMVVPKTGKLIQWDVNATKLYDGFLHCFDKNRRIIIDKSSTISSNIQPFDITFCRKRFKTMSNWTSVAYPEIILMPDQVIDFIYSGYEIISNVLPWDVLSKFVKNRYVDGGVVNAAIVKCQEHRFIFGSLQLEEALKEIKYLGKSGMSEDIYHHYHQQLVKDTGRVNERTREVVKQTLIYEGKPLTQLLDLLFVEERKQQLFCVKSISKGATLEDFRNIINNEVVNAFKKGKNRKKILTLILTKELGPYAGLNKKIKDLIVKSLNDLETKILKNVKLPKTYGKKSLMANLIFQELKISNCTHLSVRQNDSIIVKIKSIRKSVT